MTKSLCFKIFIYKTNNDIVHNESTSLHLQPWYEPPAQNVLEQVSVPARPATLLFYTLLKVKSKTINCTESRFKRINRLVSQAAANLSLAVVYSRVWLNQIHLSKYIDLQREPLKNWYCNQEQEIREASHIFISCRRALVLTRELLMPEGAIIPYLVQIRCAMCFA